MAKVKKVKLNDSGYEDIKMFLDSISEKERYLMLFSLIVADAEKGVSNVRRRKKVRSR